VNPIGAHLDDERAQQLVDGALPPAEAARAAEHAAGCPGCAALVESYRALSLELDALPGPDLPDDFTASVLARVEDRERALARERRTAVAVLGAIALGLVGALVVGGNGAWVPAATELAGRLGSMTHTLRLGAQVLPPVLGALRLPIAVACAGLILPLLLALSRLIPSPRTEAT
jgi:anti-sigma factor RsiW